MQLVIRRTKANSPDIGAGVYNYLTIWMVSFIFIGIILNLPRPEQNFGIMLQLHIPLYKGVVIILGTFTDEQIKKFTDGK